MPIHERKIRRTEYSTIIKGIDLRKIFKDYFKCINETIKITINNVEIENGQEIRIEWYHLDEGDWLAH